MIHDVILAVAVLKVYTFVFRTRRADQLYIILLRLINVYLIYSPAHVELGSCQRAFDVEIPGDHFFQSQLLPNFISNAAGICETFDLESLHDHDQSKYTYKQRKISARKKRKEKKVTRVSGRNPYIRVSLTARID